MTLGQLLEKWIDQWAVLPVEFKDTPLHDWLAIKIRESWPTLGSATEAKPLSDKRSTLEVTNAAQDAVVGVQQPAKGEQ